MNLRELAQSMSDAQMVALAQYRGGCSCRLSPPCFNCSEPLTEDEAIEIGLIVEPEEVETVDYLGEVRRLCK